MRDARSTMIKLLTLSVAIVLVAEGKTLSKTFDTVPTIISRSEWGAKPPKAKADPLLVNPPTHVIIHHAASDTCTTRAICQARVRAFQNYHMNEKKWSDIGYNFVVGEDGNVYEGRGWGKTGAHTKGYNSKSIGICIIGTYDNRVPNGAAVEAVKNLIAYGVSQGNINEKYSLIGHRQGWATSCPGNKLYQLIQTWPHWTKNP